VQTNHYFLIFLL